MSRPDRTEGLTPDIFAAIARDTFGSSARVSSVEKLTHGVDNQPYRVQLHGHDRAYVFRFRRWRQDNYRHEIDNYQRIHRLTGVRVPTIYGLDQSETIAPTAYVVMDYLQGIEAGACPDDKGDGVEEQIGRFTALVHQDARDAQDPEVDVDIISVRLDFIEQAVRAGFVELDLAVLAQCKEAVRSDPLLRSDRESFCLNDTEFYFSDGDYRLSFVLDPEWAHYATIQLDLWPRMARAERIWDKAQPVEFLPPQTAPATPFFRGYEQVAALDYERLHRVAPYYQLSIWGTVLNSQEREPDNRRRTGSLHGDEIRTLARLIGDRAG